MKKNGEYRRKPEQTGRVIKEDKCKPCRKVELKAATLPMYLQPSDMVSV